MFLGAVYQQLVASHDFSERPIFVNNVIYRNWFQNHNIYYGNCILLSPNLSMLLWQGSKSQPGLQEVWWRQKPLLAVQSRWSVFMVFTLCHTLRLSLQCSVCSSCAVSQHYQSLYLKIQFRPIVLLWVSILIQVCFKVHLFWWEMRSKKKQPTDTLELAISFNLSPSA